MSKGTQTGGRHKRAESTASRSHYIEHQYFITMSTIRENKYISNGSVTFESYVQENAYSDYWFSCKIPHRKLENEHFKFKYSSLVHITIILQWKFYYYYLFISKFHICFHSDTDSYSKESVHVGRGLWPHIVDISEQFFQVVKTQE